MTELENWVLKALYVAIDDHLLQDNLSPVIDLISRENGALVIRFTTGPSIKVSVKEFSPL